MAQYTLLLVDDEAVVLETIMKKLDWDALGFTVIGGADNGVKAFEMIEQRQPDVVLTDIRMPYMDGLALIARTRAEYPATQFVIFTGFDEFEYAKQAIRLDVGEYLLKPASAAELTATFTQLKAKLDQAFADSRNVESLQQYYDASLPLMQANFYASVIEGRLAASELPQYLADYQLQLTGPYYCCVVVHTSITQAPADISPRLLAASVQKQAKAYFADRWAAAYLTYLGDTVMVVQLPQQAAIAALTDAADAFCRYVHRLLGAVVTVGIGAVGDHLLDLEQSYTGARMAVSYRSVYGASRVINIKEVAPAEGAEVSPANDTALAALFKKIHVGPTPAIESAVDRYMAHLEATATTIPQHTVAVAELIGALYRFAVTNHLEAGPLTDNVKGLYLWLPDLEPQSLRQWVLDVSRSLHTQLQQARNSTTASLVSQAQEYVQHHYADAQLGLDDLCQALGVSKSYFSSMFKRETGHSFVTYLTDYRLDRAARLLVETNEKSHVIGRQVGYADPNYFSYVFKRRFGRSPLKYRTELVANEG